MFDFLRIASRAKKNGVIEVYPKFVMMKSSDLMIRGGDFYAIWVESRRLWSTDEDDVIQMIDNELSNYAKDLKERTGDNCSVLYMWDSSSGMIDAWHKYCQKQMRDNYHNLDEKLIFSNTEVKKEDYASKRLPYPLSDSDTPAWDKLLGTLYSPEERHKLEWAIGSIVSGDSKKLQKFMVLYGSAGTGKSTVLNIIQDLFDGYYSVFDAKAVGSSSNTFALESFKNNPLVAIQHDGDLSNIDNNARINSLVSHEMMTVNQKFKAEYSTRFHAFLFMGTNKPVKITDAKSGLIRRLIDVTPSGNKLGIREYNKAMKDVKFELGGIAKKCLDIYLADPDYYNTYIPLNMMGATNDFYNFMLEYYYMMKKEDKVTLSLAWEWYKDYCTEAKVPYPLSKRVFKEELKNYFEDYKERLQEGDNRIRSCYIGFKTDKFEEMQPKEIVKNSEGEFPQIVFKEGIESAFDKLCINCPAQLATAQETPSLKWSQVKTTLEAINTKKLHYVKIPSNHIVIDFDIPGKDGKKNFEANLKEASKWPPTYAELSKSGAGIHLHYIYEGDVEKLARLYADHIEIKVYSGNASLRRKLTKCNDLPIATISSGLPIRKEKKMINNDAVQSEKGIRTLIKKNLNKEIHPGTKPSIDFIFKILEDAYEAGVPYDVTDMRNAVLAFAVGSTNQSEYCVKLVNQMKFKSENMSESTSLDRGDDSDIIFYDVEVFPNLFLVNFKIRGNFKPVIRMINPTPTQIEDLLHHKLVGFNCRRYDNHIMYARMMGYTNEQLYQLSQKIISGDSRNAMFSEAYNLSYTDVYDYLSAGNKMSLKKWEINLHIHHQELGLPWDQPVPEELWDKVAEYCDNDVIATEAVFDATSADWIARQILADLADGSFNDTTNTLTTKIIFGKNRNPQSEFNYRDLSQPVFDLDPETRDFLTESCPEMMKVTHGEAGSILPYFPGYKFENGKSYYRGEEIGEGGYVYAEPGMYGEVALLDIISMHPHSLLAECLFGVLFTTAFREIVEGRVSIKHEAWEEVNGMLGGKLTPYIQKVKDGKLTSKDLANALKTAINSVYGLTSAKFDNPFRDKRNVDNIVAKRGELFMIDLKHEVQKRGFTVAHIKTDSIKIPDATPEIIEFVMNFGKKYGYTFEHEATYERMCLVNKAVYIAKYKDGKHAGEWTATGDQFAVPYIFKTLFSKEPLVFDDFCETFAVSKGDLYLDMNENLPDVSAEEKELSKLETKYKKGELSDTTFESEGKRLNDIIEKGHDLHFVGRVGQFTPIQAGCGGGILYRVNEGKNYAAPGSTGYRWLESEMVENDERDDQIDKSFYQNLADDAIKTIIAYGDYEWFVSDAPYVGPEFAEDEYGRHPVYHEEMPWY